MISSTFWTRCRWKRARRKRLVHWNDLWVLSPPRCLDRFYAALAERFFKRPSLPNLPLCASASCSPNRLTLPLLLSHLRLHHRQCHHLHRHYHHHHRYIAIDISRSQTHHCYSYHHFHPWPVLSSYFHFAIPCHSDEHDNDTVNCVNHINVFLVNFACPCRRSLSL